MENTNTSPLSTSSKTPTDSSFQTPLAFNRSLSLDRHIDESEAKTPLAFTGNSSLPQHPPERDDLTPRGRTIAANRKMRESYPKSKYHSSLWSPELRFAMRGVGRASAPCLATQDILEGKDIFRAGLSQLPDGLFKKVYIAKRASRDCILGRLHTNLREIDALEKMKDVILEMHKQDEGQLAAISDDLERFRAEAVARGNAIDDDIAYRHAVYADEFTALASTNTQIHLMLGLSDPESTSDESDSIMSNEPADGGSMAEAGDNIKSRQKLWLVCHSPATTRHRDLRSNY